MKEGITHTFVFRRDHPANSIFQSSKVLSPGTHNYVAMKVKKTDRSKLKEDFISKLIGQTDQCQDTPDEHAGKISSIPMKEYNQQHCIKTKGMQIFENTHNCSIFPLYGSNDLDSPQPICNITKIQLLMKSMTMMRMNNASLLTCPEACIEEKVETIMSFTVLSDHQVQSSSAAWNLTKLNKEDVVIMDLFFSSSEIDVRYYIYMSAYNFICHSSGNNYLPRNCS